jgi:predicted secreted hydrolase
VGITPVDDAFHGSAKRFAAEWWYFDAIFNNGYSIHIGFRTLSKKKLGIVSLFLEIYKSGKIVIEKKKKFLFKNFKTSREFPLAKLFNNSIMEFDIDRYMETGDWLYNLKFNIDNCDINLTFQDTAKGFKIETNAESWTVALPKAHVKGKIVIDDKKILVDGVGYHDHNWNYTFISALTYGKAWFWGKIRSENYNIIWANVIKKSGKWDLIAVINKDQNCFYNINPANIDFKPDNYISDHHRKTPSRFSLKINDTIDNINVIADIKMELIGLHFSKVLSAPYWRYHVHISGFISINKKKEKIDNIQIMEFLRISS